VMGPINLAILRSAPGELRANAMAVSIFVIHAFGDLWSPPLIGYMADRGPLQTAMYLVPAMFAVAGAVWWWAVRARMQVTRAGR
jgi:hypothetical protein